ncbi:MAG: alpha-L-fucosidase [Ignavibacteriales bacterium]|nr:alpha-L-fucosidase [Ignavibacteriales bacterium]
MNYFKILIISSLLVFCAGILLSQEDEAHYVPVKDKEVQKKLAQWQDAKFGLLMHWGTYSQWGIVESWSLCGEDEGWCQRTGPYADDYEKYKQAYRDLKKTFNPIKFNPEKWAIAAKDAGMKYVVFTTKHHDGFCMFDTKTTDYKITSGECQFSSNPKSNITKEIFKEFRKNEMMTGTYFSKPDWSSDYYWWSYFPTPDRHINYNPSKHPERWKQFQDFTHNQIEELMTGYGPVDILWLDGAWVRPLENMPKEFESWAKKDMFNQDVNIPRIAVMARTHQPGLIIVDRWVNGEYENYLTPENKVPEKAMTVPWEACIPIATSWSYKQNDSYKSERELVHLLVDIVAKGGNLLLNIAPSPDGEWDSVAYERLKGIGEWMKLNNEAIYSTKPVYPYKTENVCFTSGKDDLIYAIYLGDDKTQEIPQMVTLPSNKITKGKQIYLLGYESKLKIKKHLVGSKEKILVEIPDKFRKSLPYKHTLTFKLIQ